MTGRKTASGGTTTTMAERNAIEQIVERVVSQILESHVPQLRVDLVRRVLEELQPHLGQTSRAQSAENSPANLLKAISAIHIPPDFERDLKAERRPQVVGFYNQQFLTAAGIAA